MHPKKCWQHHKTVQPIQQIDFILPSSNLHLNLFLVVKNHDQKPPKIWRGVCFTPKFSTNPVTLMSKKKTNLKMWVFPKIGVFPPKWMVKIMENPMNKWMIWGVKPPPLFLVQHPCLKQQKRLKVRASGNSKDSDTPAPGDQALLHLSNADSGVRGGPSFVCFFFSPGIVFLTRCYF